VASGLILLMLIGVLIGFALSRVRRRMGLGVTWGMWVTTVAIVVIAGLILWASSLKK
jgi:hypothetical protein